jgi:carbonic anhydrase
MEQLLEGYRRFRQETWPAERARYEALSTKGQRPHTLVVACSDSRVDPQTVFGAAPGELFVVRNVAALVPPFQPDAGYHGTSAALEFGVRALKVARIVVLGHAQCGGVQAMVEGAPEEARDFVKPWVGHRRARPANAAAAHSWRRQARLLRNGGRAPVSGEPDDFSVDRGRRRLRAARTARFPLRHPHRCARQAGRGRLCARGLTGAVELTFDADDY